MKKTDWISLVFFVFGKDCMTPHQTKKRTQFQHPSESKQRLVLVELNMHPRSQTLTEHKSAHRWKFRICMFGGLRPWVAVLTCLVPFFAWKFVALPSGCSEIWYQQNQTRFWFLVTVLPTTILQLRRAISLRHVHTNSNATTFTHHLASLAGASLRRTSSWHSWINHVESKIHGKSSVLKSCLNCMYI